jgi:hypothetical protein
VRQNRSVAAAAHRVTARCELLSELGKVVQLAVEDGDDASRLVRHGLVPEFGINHLKSLVAEHTGAERVGRALIRAAMTDARAHLVDECRLRLARRRIESADPAHAQQCA